MIKRLRRLLSNGLHPAFQAFFNKLPKRILSVILYYVSQPLNLTSVEIDGKTGPMRGSPRDTGVLGEYIMTGDYTPQMMSFLLDYFEVNGAGTFVDIGANIGFTTKPLLAIGVTCECYEPDPENFAYLAENLREYENTGLARLHNVAAYDKPSEISFERSDRNYGDHRIRVDGADKKGQYAEDKREVITIECVRLDDELRYQDLPRPLVIKIDTQGAEVNILEGGPELLAAADLLIFEYWPYGIRRQGRSEESLANFADSHFQLGHVSSDASKSPIPTKFDTIQTVTETMRQLSKTDGRSQIDVYLMKAT